MKHKKSVIAVLIIAALGAGAFFFFRGPYISNLLKKAVLTEVGSATGRQVIAQRMYVNLVPFYVGVEGVKAFNEKGDRVFAAGAVKAYVNLSGILQREIDIQRITVLSPELWTDRARLSDILQHVKAYAAKKESGGKKLIGVKVRSVSVKGGELSFYDAQYGAITTARGIDADVVLDKEPEVAFSVKEAGVAARDWPSFKGGFRGSVVLGEKAVRVGSFELASDGLSLKASGEYLKTGKADFSVDLDAPVRYAADLLELKGPAQGSVRARGSVKVVDDIRDPVVDLKVSGEFHLQTLLEALRSRDTEVLQGPVKFSGQVAGRISDLEGSGDARLKDAIIYGIRIDDVSCKVDYRDRVMRFINAQAELYGGKASAEGSISIPEIKPYTLEARFSGVDSAPSLNLVGLGGLKVPGGRVEGHVHTEGSAFMPSGWAAYRASEVSSDFLGRVREGRADFKFVGDRVEFSAGEVKTAKTAISFGGSLERPSKTVAFNVRLRTDDLRDLSSPYFEKLNGRGQFEGAVRGPVGDPLMEGKARLSAVSYEKSEIGDVLADISYRKDLLTIRDLKAAHGETAYAVAGKVDFPEAKEIFDLRKPSYGLRVSVTRGEAGDILGLFGLAVPVKGTVDSTLRVEGSLPKVSGSAKASEARVYGVAVPKVSFDYVYEGRVFKVDKAVAQKGDSVLRFKGKIARGGAFSFSASSNKFFLRDAAPSALPVDYRMSIEAEGDGTFGQPRVRLKANLADGSFRGAPIGGGTMAGTLKGREVVFEGKLIDGRMHASGRASLEGGMPWSAELSLDQGRYDFIVSPFLQEVPEDLMLNLEGSVSLSGDRNTLRAKADFERTNVMLYGQSFTNVSDIAFSLDGRDVEFSSFVMRSGNTSFSVSGGLDIGTSYNVVLEGSSSLSPLKALSRKIETLRGDADFVMALQGQWKRPVINGGLSISGGSFALKNSAQRLTSINGYIYVDEDRAVIQGLTARLGGGVVELSGVVHLEGFGLKRVSLDAVLKDVTVNASKDFVVNVGGNLLFRGNTESGDLAGELKINRARYTERVEWKSWLLKAKPPILPRAETGWADRIELNIKLYGSDNIVIENNVARAPLKIDMVVRGSVASPRLLGRLETKEGKVYFRNNEFTILNATADFSGVEGSPFVEILAETTTKGYQIQLSLEGRMDQFDLALSSEPPLDEVEILSLLTVGEFGESLNGLERGIGAAEATSFLTGKFQDVMEERLTDITGLTRFQIDPAVSTTGAVTPRITVSKRLLGDRMFVTYSTAVGSVEQQELKLEYLLNDNVSLLGVRDEQGSLGGDIKFRFRFK